MNAPIDLPTWLTGTIKWSEPSDKTGSTIARHSGTWSDLIDRLRNAGTHAAKDQCPWIKLATFGDRRSGSGSLRTNENVVSVCGVEGDYDGEAVTIEQAAALLEQRQIRAALYPSPSSTTDKPRWRVICPTSRELPPTAREGLVGLLNGILDGVLAAESFTLSQSYYFGGTSTNDYRVVVTEGLCIDQVPAALLPRSIGRSGAADAGVLPCPPAKGVGAAVTLDCARDMLTRIPAGCTREDWRNVGMGLQHEFGDAGFDLWNTWSQTCSEKYPGPRVMAQQWASFRDNKATAITMGTVLKLARDAGWVRPQPDVLSMFAATSAHPEWPDPVPLPTLPKVPAFDLAWLPDAIREHVADVAQRMQCPPDMPAVGALGSLSAAIGRRERIMPKVHDTWTVFPNLWGMVVAPPGWKKSPALAAMLAPLHGLEREASREHDAALADWAMEKERIALSNSAARSAGMQALKKNPAAEVTGLLAEPAEPVPRRYVVNNFSLEALAEVMIGNPNGVLAFGDELHGLLKMADKAGNEELHAFLLMGWNGDDSFTLDRIGRGRRYVDHVCLSIVGGIQPGRLQEYLTEGGSGGAIGSGFMNRFQLVTWPDLPDEYTYIDRAPDRAAQEAYQSVFNRLAGGQGFPNLTANAAIPMERGARHFDAEAQKVFQDWHERNDRLCRSETLAPVMASHLSKYPSLVASLALILAVAEDVQGDVPARHVHQAINLAEYFRAHAERVFSCTTRPDTAHAHALLGKIRAGAVDDGFTARDVYRNEWSLLHREGTEKAIALLCDHDYLARVESPHNGPGRPPGATFRINPNAKR